MSVVFKSRYFILEGHPFRFFLTLLLVTGLPAARAQEIRVERSLSTVVMDGKRFYLHRVEAGQTLFSIARAYEVTVKELREANGRTGDALATGEVLQVPYVEPYRPTDDTYYYHAMKPGETLYSLSRQFGVRVKQILRDNPRLDEERAIPEGFVVRLLLKQADRAAVARAARQALEERNSTLDRRAAAEVAAMEHVPVAPPPPPDRPSARVSVLLPFGIADNKLPVPGEVGLDGTGAFLSDERWRLSPRSEPFLEFYAGLLLAVDSLKHAGHSITLQVFDTGRDSTRVEAIMEEVNRFAPHVIIGPVHANECAWVARRLSRRDVPLVYPLSARPEGLGRYPHFVQVTGSTPALLDAMARWTARRGESDHVIAILPPERRGEEDALPEQARRYLAATGKELTSFHWDGASLAPLKELLLADRENVILFPTLDEALASRLLPGLSAWAGRYRMTVVGFPEWLKFTAVDEETFFKLNLTIFQTAHVNWESPRAAAFAERYRRCFHADPSIVACKGFDAGLFFIRHVAAHPGDALARLPGLDATGDFTRFRFVALPGLPGIENRGFFVVNYSSAFEIRVTPLE
ncbi:MAG: LysM peptidoglycan-binding domain-containing protein [Odoribacteraceae bacterium]|jgi:LysM repeat protein|nr:LysM peptidoglycan-binding domain-containing protein [Odoribacteraceae bacterium]